MRLRNTAFSALSYSTIIDKTNAKNCPVFTRGELLLRQFILTNNLNKKKERVMLLMSSSFATFAGGGGQRVFLNLTTII
jgi:hypothetical protein